jgi:hypothetical protein
LTFSVEEVGGVTRLSSLGHTERTLEFTSGGAGVDVLRSGDDNLLLFVVVSSAFSLVLGLLNGCFLVALVQVEDNVGVEGLDLLLQVRYTLDSIYVKYKVSHQNYEVRGCNYAINDYNLIKGVFNI